MQELAIKTYLVLEGLADRLVEMRQERGQTAAEYVGVIAFVAAIVAVLATFEIRSPLRSRKRSSDSSTPSAAASTTQIHAFEAKAERGGPDHSGPPRFVRSSDRRRSRTLSDRTHGFPKSRCRVGGRRRAALEAAKNMRDQLVGQATRLGFSDITLIDESQVCAAAQDYAAKNGGRVTSCDRDGLEVTVAVESVDALGENADRIGAEGATALHGPGRSCNRAS